MSCRALLLISALAWSLGCGFSVNDVRCRADADCSGDTLCIGGFCEAPVDRPPVDGGPIAPDAGEPFVDAGGDPLEVELQADPTTALIGESVTLNWTSTGGVCTLNGEPVEVSGSIVLPQPLPARHELVCVQGGQRVTDTVDVDVACGDITEVPQPADALRSEADIEAALSGAAGCFRVAGTLTLAGSDLEDLTSLYGLVEVTADLNINDNPSLRSLSGLGLLENIGSRLSLAGNLGNDLLVDLRGLERLTTVLNSVTITDNLRLTSLRGLEGLRSSGNLLVNANLNLVDIDALSGLTNLTRLTIQDNLSLENLDGLAGVTTAPTTIDVSIRSNPRLRSLGPLSWLNEVDFLEIENNDQLEALDGLENITYVRELELISNDALTDVSKIVDITGEMTCLRIENNENLLLVEGFNNINLLPGEGCNELTLNNNGLDMVVDGFDSLTTVGRLELGRALADAEFPALQTASEIFVDVTRLTDTDIFPSLATVSRLRFDDADRVVDLVLPQATITSLFITDNNLLETIDVNGATATCWTVNANNLALPQAEIDRVTDLLGAPQATCP